MNQRKNIVILGGGSGIGKAIIDQLIIQPCNIIVWDCDHSKIEVMKNEYQGKSQKNLEFLQVDMSDRDSVQKGLSRVKTQLGSIDSFIITAAIHSAYPVEYLTDENIDQVLNVNLTAHIKLVRDALPLIKDGGRIIAVSSIAAGLGVPMEAMYSASKAGLEAFYESLSAEVSYRKIRCVIIHPGNVNTGFNEKGNDYQARGNEFIDTGYRRVVSGIDSSKGMPAEEVASIIIKALNTQSPRFSYVVGLNAKKAYWAKRILGRDLALKLMSKYFGF